MTTKVRFCLPAVIWRVRACTISGEFRKRWKLTRTNKAVPSARRGAQGPYGGQRILAGVGSLLFADQQTPVDVPGGQTPILGAAQLGDLGQRVFVFM